MTASTPPADLVTEVPANVYGTGSFHLREPSYAGYADAPFKGKTAQLFYWFFSARDASRGPETPLIIWLNGGPGASSMLGLFQENGPLQFVGDNIQTRPCAWNRHAHMIFWDQPIGTGYSRVEEEGAHETTFVADEDELSEVFYEALQSFYDLHPEYRACPLYVTGESYAGKYVPNIAWRIHEKNRTAAPHRCIPLRGIAVGDGWIDAQVQMRIYIDYAAVLGLIDTRQKAFFDTAYARFVELLDEGKYKEAYDVYNDVIVVGIVKAAGGFDIYDARSFVSISTLQIRSYLTSASVKQALHVPADQPWNYADNSGPVSDNLIPDNVADSSSLYTDIIEAGYRVLMYAGIFDTVCGAAMTEAILWKIGDDAWRSAERGIWGAPTKGYVKRVGNLTQIALPSAGHMVPYYLPEISLEMIETWLADRELPCTDPLRT